MKFEPGERAARLAAARERRAIARADRRAAATGRKRTRPKTKAELEQERYVKKRLLRRPAWADVAEMTRLRSQAFERNMVVDHVIPLMGYSVSGLDVPANMQLLTWDENHEKGVLFRAADFDYQRGP